MVIYVNETVINTVLKTLDISYEEIDREVLKRHIFKYSEKGNFYLEEAGKDIVTIAEPDKDEASESNKPFIKAGNTLMPGYKEKETVKAVLGEEVIKVELSGEDAWKLDKFQSCVQYSRRAVRIEKGNLLKLSEEEALFNQQEGLLPEFAYFKRSELTDPDFLYNIEEMKSCIEKKRQLDMCDVYLTIPGKMTGEDAANSKELWKNYINNDNEIYGFFKDNIDEAIASEYSNRFIDKIDRTCLGTVLIEIENDLTEGRSFKQPGIIEVVKHETGLCIVEILVHNCYIGGNKLLNYYRGNMLKFTYNGAEFTLDELLELFSIKGFGEKRSVVFAYGDISEEAVVNALANEEYPMGKIEGEFARRVKEENVAQYDNAEVYVSGVTMIECCRNITDELALLLRNRLAYQVIEIFFVELLLFQDAAMDKIYHDLTEEQELQRIQGSDQVDIERFEQLSFDMARAIKFSDYNQFTFPTTRESAKRVAKNFGIDEVFEKYQQNKYLLEQMIKANQRRTEERENDLKNKFLIILSFATTVTALCEFISPVINLEKTEIIVYIISVAIVIIGFVVFKAKLRKNNRETRKKL